jgi:hypothetical protein
MTPDYSFQAGVIAEAERQLTAGEKVLLVSPTGSGKTVMGTEIVKSAVGRRECVLFLAHRREIIGSDFTEAAQVRFATRHHSVRVQSAPSSAGPGCFCSHALRPRREVGRDADAAGGPDRN